MSIFGYNTGEIIMGIFDAVADFAGSIYHEVTGTLNEDQKRAQQSAINAQINFYKQQTDISNSAVARSRAEQLNEKHRIEEKKIRSLRHNFRPAGFMNSEGGASGGDMSDKLGA